MALFRFCRMFAVINQHITAMRKLITLIIVSTLSMCMYAQSCISSENVSVENNHIVLKGVVKVDSVSASTIHDAIIKWISLSYNDPKTVIKSDMPSTVVFEGFLPSTSKFDHIARVVFEIKDGRYRWTISNILFYSELIASLGGDLKTEIETQPWYTDASDEERINEIIKRYSDAPCTIIKGIDQCIHDVEW